MQDTSDKRWNTVEGGDEGTGTGDCGDVRDLTKSGFYVCLELTSPLTSNIWIRQQARMKR